MWSIPSLYNGFYKNWSHQNNTTCICNATLLVFHSHCSGAISAMHYSGCPVHPYVVDISSAPVITHFFVSLHNRLAGSIASMSFGPSAAFDPYFITLDLLLSSSPRPVTVHSENSLHAAATIVKKTTWLFLLSSLQYWKTFHCTCLQTRTRPIISTNRYTTLPAPAAVLLPSTQCLC